MDCKYCNAACLRGSVFSYSGPTDADSGVNLSSAMHGVDAPAGNYRLSLTAGPAGYAGGGISFDSCVNATSFNALRFSAWIASGDITGCNFKVQLQTFEQRPTSQAPPGLCDTAVGSCYGFPASPNLTLTTTPTPITVPFADFTTNATHANPAPARNERRRPIRSLQPPSTGCESATTSMKAKIGRLATRLGDIGSGPTCNPAANIGMKERERSSASSSRKKGARMAPRISAAPWEPYERRVSEKLNFARSARSSATARRIASAPPAWRARYRACR